MSKRIQINTTISKQTKQQITELRRQCGYSLRDVITLSVEQFHKSKIREEVKIMFDPKKAAENRVYDDPELAQHADMLLNDEWRETSPEEHFEWVANAPHDELIDWAEQ